MESDDPSKRIQRLERRIQRERTAREEAESIADRRMRELWIANQDLDRRVADRTESLEVALEQLERATNATAGFFSSLSHEMMTPLNGIIGMLDLLADNAYTETNRSWTEAALKSADRLSFLLHRLLDLGEIRSGRVAFSVSQVRCGDLADQLAQQWQSHCLKRQKLLSVSSGASENAQIWIDLRLTERILAEFISNASLHAESGVVSVEVGVDDPAAPSWLTITVKDNGNGFVVPESRDLMTAMAEADHSPARTHDGLGIGLSFAGHLAELLGGRADIVSAPGSPTEVTVWIPNQEPANEESASSETTDAIPVNLLL